MAARAPDPHNLREMNKRAAPVIQVDRLCVSCGYNLRGLREGINCPECSMPSKMPEGIDDPLAHMPMRIILALVRGCWVASACVLLMVGVLLAERFGALPRTIAMAILAGLSLLWIGATRWLTPAFGLPQAIMHGFGPRSRTRTLARLLQWGWVLGTGCAAATAIFSSLPGMLADLLSIVQFLGVIIGLSGLVVLSIMMERLAEWARDEDAQRMFNWAMWSWPLAILLYVPLQFFIGSWLASSGRYQVLPGLFVLLWIAAIGTFPYGLLMLAKSVTLSVVHNIEYQGRMQRKQERDDRYHSRAGMLAERTEPNPHCRPAHEPPRRRPREGPPAAKRTATRRKSNQ